VGCVQSGVMRLDVVIFHFYIFGLFLFLVIKKIKTLADQLISATSRAAREAWPKGRQVLSAVAPSATLIRLLTDVAIGADERIDPSCQSIGIRMVHLHMHGRCAVC
jgi:hypothetical protein